MTTVLLEYKQAPDRCIEVYNPGADIIIYENKAFVKTARNIFTESISEFIKEGEGKCR